MEGLFGFTVSGLWGLRLFTSSYLQKTPPYYTCNMRLQYINMCMYNNNMYIYIYIFLRPPILKRKPRQVSRLSALGDGRT